MFLKRYLLFLGLFICFISKSQAPIADFSASPLVACVGENILFIKDGNKIWEGTSKEILTASNKDLQNFVFSSELFKTIKTKSL